MPAAIPIPAPPRDNGSRPAGGALSGVFRHPFNERDGWNVEDRAMPANERNMCALSATLRAKPSWWTKYTDPEIRARWKAEAVGAPVPYGKVPLTEGEVDYVLDELEHYAAVRDPGTGIEASIAARIWQSDTLISDSLRDALLACVAKLEDVPESMRDWHPRSNGQVLDLVHPSLYPLLYGRTLSSWQPNEEGRPPRHVPLPQYADASDEKRNIEIIQPREYSAVEDAFTSRRFQWLPTDFAVSADGASARSLAYINSLDPRTHRAAYPVVEALVARFVPLWERVLGETAAGYAPPARTSDRYELDYVDLEEGEERSDSDEDEYEDEDENEDEEDRHRRVYTLPPLLGSFKGHTAPPTVDLKGRTLQVIVKLASIHLTPEKPEYAGGTWHVEGMINEAIVSTGIYYFDEANVTESRLAFRTPVDEPFYAEQDDHEGSLIAWGFEGHEPLVQPLGAVVTKRGRCLAFPNAYQHQVQPFSLTDRSKPGHRKIVALFLVDPCLAQPRPSTTTVPAQQREWVVAATRELGATPQSRLSRLPAELRDAVLLEVDGLMSREEAEAVRLELMNERSATHEKGVDTFAVTFNMCEH